MTSTRAFLGLALASSVLWLAQVPPTSTKVRRSKPPARASRIVIARRFVRSAVDIAWKRARGRRQSSCRRRLVSASHGIAAGPSFTGGRSAIAAIDGAGAGNSTAVTAAVVTKTIAQASFLKTGGVTGH